MLAECPALPKGARRETAKACCSPDCPERRQLCPSRTGQQPGLPMQELNCPASTSLHTCKRHVRNQQNLAARMHYTDRPSARVNRPLRRQNTLTREYPEVNREPMRS